MEDIKLSLTPESYLVVLDDDLKAVGFISLSDMANYPKGRIKSLSFLKSPVTPNCEILEALTLMDKLGTNVLPVYLGKEFVGVVCYHELTRQLAKQLDRYRFTLQQVAHDLRNPLLNIIGLTTLLEESLEKPENLTITSMTKESSIHALDIVSGLLFIENKENEPSGTELTDLNEFIKECVNSLRGVLSLKKIDLTCELAPEKFLYQIDRLLLKRAIHNLTSNAIKFSHPGSRIYVSSFIEEKRFVLKITDTGIGIPVQQQAFVFDQFTLTSRPGTAGEKSIGLGLYFVKASIARLGGRIWFESREGEGTTFFIEFSG